MLQAETLQATSLRSHQECAFGRCDKTLQEEPYAVIEFKLPELGENIEQGDLVRLMVAPGAAVSAGQSVMELETDKAVVEVPSSVSGTVQEVRVKEGDKVKVGQVIFTVENGSGAKSAESPAAKSTAPSSRIE